MNMTQELWVSEKVVVVNMFYDTGLSLESDQVDVEKYKKEICHLAFVGLRRDSCVKFFTQNWCPWFKTPEEHLPIWATNIICETKTLNTPGLDVSPFCYDGPGWRGILETAMEGGVHHISWKSLVKQPHCGGMVFVRDELTGLQKGFWTTFTEVYFPIENVESTCNLTIKIHYPFPRQNVWKCFTVTAKVGCKNEAMNANISHNMSQNNMSQPVSQNNISHNISHNDTGRNETSTNLGMKSGFTNATVCATIISVAVIIAITAIVMRWKKKREVVENPREEEELNTMYGTYYQGVEYNTATDDNPRYNEDGGNADAIVIDENTHYHNSRCSVNEGSNGATPTDENIYFQL